MSKVLGCDCSSKLIGCVQLEDNKVLTSVINGASAESFEFRLKTMYYEFKTLLKTWKPDVVYIEQAIYLQNVKVTLMIDATINGVRFASIDALIPYQIVDNRAWKKDVLGSGKASKEQITDFTKAKWGDIFKTQDERDAACIAFYGYRRMNNA